jgi:hypothetical protein
LFPNRPARTAEDDIDAAGFNVDPDGVAVMCLAILPYRWVPRFVMRRPILGAAFHPVNRPL